MRARLVIIGRPNVGKSTLFNRLLGRRRALVHDMPGVTRDRLEELAKWTVRGAKLELMLVDTGGLGGEKWASEIEHQVQTALTTADVVIALFDAHAGLTPQDEDILRKLNQAGFFQREKSRIPVIGVVNKVDAESHEQLMADFFASGLDPILTISAEHARGIDDLKEAVAAALESQGKLELENEPEDEDEEVDVAVDEEGEPELPPIGTNELDPEMMSEKSPRNRIPKIAIVGKPNAGKSTLVNALVGEERMITSPIAGTTVDSVDSLVAMGGKPFVIIDTAGIRRKSKTEQGVEVLSVVQARKALERCDVAVLVIDGAEGITDQDEKIGGLIEEVGCSVVLVINKWDVQRRDNPKFTKEMAAEQVRKKMAYLRYAPVMFTSALKGQGFEDLGDLIEEILNQRQVKVQTHEFSEWVRNAAQIHNPANAKFFLCHQSGRNPPTFVCHVNDPDKVHFSLRRHLVNGIRERWGYMGSPIRLLFLEGKNRKSLPKAKKGPARTKPVSRPKARVTR